jgi:uncharacterized protein YndB with AHSA1/START domain
LSCFHITNSLRRNVTTQRDNERAKIPPAKSASPFYVQKGDKGGFKTEQKTNYLKIRCVITEKQDMSGNTVTLHRVLKTTPEKIYHAFLDADALCKWLPPHGFTGKAHHLDATVGGSYKMSFTNFSTGHGHSFGGTYLELIPNERIVHTDVFDNPNLPGTMKVTIVIKKVSVGTELSITQEGIPDPIPLEACYLGWQESLMLLTQLVEPDIPD